MFRHFRLFFLSIRFVSCADCVWLGDDNEDKDDDDVAIAFAVAVDVDDDVDFKLQVSIQLVYHCDT